MGPDHDFLPRVWTPPELWLYPPTFSTCERRTSVPFSRYTLAAVPMESRTRESPPPRSIVQLVLSSEAPSNSSAQVVVQPASSQNDDATGETAAAASAVRPRERSSAGRAIVNGGGRPWVLGVLRLECVAAPLPSVRFSR